MLLSFETPYSLVSAKYCVEMLFIAKEKWIPGKQYYFCNNVENPPQRGFKSTR